MKANCSRKRGWSHLTLLSFFVFSSTSCCIELKVSIISRVSSSRNIICCFISLSLLICNTDEKRDKLNCQTGAAPSKKEGEN